MEVTSNHQMPDPYKQIFYEHYPSVLRKLKALVSDHGIAEDLAQEVFVKLYKQPPDDLERIGGWLHRVLTHSAYDYIRSEARRRTIRDKYPELQESNAVHPSGEETALAALERTEVSRMLERLPDRDRQALMLRHSGYSYTEIAEKLDVNRDLIGTILNRAAEKFRKQSKEEFGYETR